MNSANQSAPITFTDAETHRCPFDAYNRLRNEAPVYFDPGTKHYVLTRYADVRGAILNPRLFSNDVGLVGIRESAVAEQIAKMYEEEGWPQRHQMQSKDPPLHKAMRSRADKAFSRWNVTKIEPMIEALAEEIIDEFIDKDEIEFVNQFAARMTIAVISQQLGVVRGDQNLTEYTRQIQTWSDLAIEVIDPLLKPERHIEITRELIRMQHFYVANIKRVHAAPDDTLLSQFIQNVQVDGEPDIPEILELMKMVLVTGNETTRFAMATGMKLWTEEPHVPERLAANPDLIPAFTEEALRIRSPVQTLFRRTTEDVELHGMKIPKGATVEVRFGAANRDPAMFENPANLMLDRANGLNHLTFGAGIHVCIGMLLARTELVIGYRALLRRLKNFRPARGEASFDYNRTYLSHGLTRLDLAFDKRI